MHNISHLLSQPLTGSGHGCKLHSVAHHVPLASDANVLNDFRSQLLPHPTNICHHHGSKLSNITQAWLPPVLFEQQVVQFTVAAAALASG